MPIGGHFISPAPGIPSELGPQDAGESLSVAPAALRVDAATNIGGTVNASASWISSWFDTLGMSQVVTVFRSTQAGTFAIQFSADGVTADLSATGNLTANVDLPQQSAPPRRYARVSYTNTSGLSATVRIETTMRAIAGIIGSRVIDAVGPYAGAAVVKAIPFGFTEGGGIYQRASMSVQGHQEVDIQGPRTAFGELAVAQDTPALHVQQFQYGVISRLIASQVSGSGTVATGTGTERTLLVASTGTTTGSMSAAESARRINYKAGLGIKVALTARFATPEANTTQIAGLFDACDGIGIGCNGSEVGILYRAFGQRELRKLTVSAAATGAETATVTLNSQSRTVALTSGTKLQTANALAAADYSAVGTGWDAWVLQPSVGDPKVWFLARAASSQSGTYSLSSSGGHIRAGHGRHRSHGHLDRTDLVEHRPLRRQQHADGSGQHEPERHQHRCHEAERPQVPAPISRRGEHDRVARKREQRPVHADPHRPACGRVHDGDLRQHVAAGLPLRVERQHHEQHQGGHGVDVRRDGRHAPPRGPGGRGQRERRLRRGNGPSNPHDS